MRPSKFTDDEIVQALRQVKAGTPAVQVCRKLGITQTTFYRWRKKYEGVKGGGSREVRELRDENQRLKEIVANLLLDRQGSTDFRKKKIGGPAAGPPLRLKTWLPRASPN
jgi:putative transposase